MNSDISMIWREEFEISVTVVCLLTVFRVNILLAGERPYLTILVSIHNLPVFLLKSIVLGILPKYILYITVCL